MKSLLYFQSGGPTPVINTSLYGVIQEAKRHSEIDGIYGSLFGIEGVINDNLIDLRQEDDEQIELLKQTPGAILGTTRYKLSDDLGHPDYYKILTTLKNHNVGYLLVNGGNDSMDTCHKLSQFMKTADYDCAVIGIPKTIDNDLNYTDHCLGYPSAAKYVVQTLQDIAIDNTCYNKGKVAIVEVMGRNAGWLTAAAALLEGEIKPDRIYLPEESFHLDKFLDEIKAIYAEKKKAFIVISEGVAPFLSSAFATVDSFNHAQLGGIANILGDQIKVKLGFPVRAIEFSLMQRAAAAFISQVDREEALKISRFAVRSVVKGKTNAMVIIARLPGPQYKVHYQLKNLRHIANVERKMSAELIKDVHGEGRLMKEYLKPLIDGNVKFVQKDGVIAFAKLKKIKI
ncbi:MAG: diphosphate--fructose-6-phosphate 1-phosphotransferase [Bacilli bacterium]|jgi:6-phosphofructokinase 1